MKHISSHKLLPSLGFDEKTEAVWRALLALADAPASTIARRAGVKRTSTYHILENLISMGLIASYKEGGTTRFAAEHPSRLKTYFERSAILAERVIPDLEREMGGKNTRASVRFFDGAEAVRKMSEETLETKNKTIHTIGSTKNLLEILEGKFGFGKRRRAKGIFIKGLRARDDDVINSPARLHDFRFLPDGFFFPGYVTIFDESVSIIFYDKPPKGVLVSSASFSNMMKSIFDELWKSAPPSS